MNGLLYITSGGIRTVDQVAIGAPQETNEEEGGQLSLIGTKESDGYMIDQIPGQNKYGCLRFFSDASISKEPMQTITFTYNNFNSPVLSIGDRSGGTDSRLYVRDIEGIKFGEDQAQLYLNFENRNGTINYGPISIVSPSLKESTYTQLRLTSDDNPSAGLLLQNFAVTEEQPNEGFQLVQFNSIGEKGVIDFLFDQDNNPFINLFYTINCHNAVTFLENGDYVTVYFTDPRISQSINNLNVAKSYGWFLDSIMKWGGRINRRMAKLMTTYSPEFVISNIVRDYQEASANLMIKEGLKYTRTFESYYFNPELGAAIRRRLNGKKGDTEIDKYVDEFFKSFAAGVRRVHTHNIHTCLKQVSDKVYFTTQVRNGRYDFCLFEHHNVLI